MRMHRGLKFQLSFGKTSKKIIFLPKFLSKITFYPISDEFIENDRGKVM